MNKTVDYYFSLISPWTYLGDAKFQDIAARQGARIVYKPMKLSKVFPSTGGLPLAKRAPQRQDYRLVELARWSKLQGLPLNLHPKYFPCDESRAASSRGRDQKNDVSGCYRTAKVERGVNPSFFRALGVTPVRR